MRRLFCALAKEDGNQVAIFLIDDGVIFARLGTAERYFYPNPPPRHSQAAIGKASGKRGT